MRQVKPSRKVSILNLTSEPLQTRPSSGETDRELISLSCAATPAFALRGTSPLASISASSQVQTLMVRSLITREAYFRRFDSNKEYKCIRELSFWSELVM
jgi:hypothetical protein